MASSANELSTTLNSLSINPSSTTKPLSKTTKKTKTPIADSWEDEFSDSSSTETETETGGETSVPTSTSNPLSPTSSFPAAPPPTPISPPPEGSNEDILPSSTSKSKPLTTTQTIEFENPYGYPGPSSYSSPSQTSRAPERRQEKTDAVARRLIAGALGVRAPKKTEEQREYERVQREKEVRRRKEEREEEGRRKEEEERKKRGAWDD